MLINKTKVKKILVINLAFIGDVILSMPTTQVLKNAFPEAKIDCLSTLGAADVAAADPVIADVIIYDKTGLHKNIWAFWRLACFLKSREYDMVLCTNFAIRGALLAWMMGSPCRIGYDIRGARFLLTHAASADRTAVKHEAEYRLDQLKIIGIDDTDICVQYRLDEKAAINSGQILQDQGLVPDEYVVICPAGRLETKSWSISKMAEVVDWIYARFGHRSILIGGEKDRTLIEEITSKCSSAPVQAAGIFNLRELPHIIKNSKLVISVDTGPMHMAAALNIPLLALFGPTDPVVWGPLNKNSIVIQAKEKNMANIELKDVQNILQEMLEVDNE